jgi:hypothetical protein
MRGTALLPAPLQFWSWIKGKSVRGDAMESYTNPQLGLANVDRRERVVEDNPDFSLLQSGSLVLTKT